MRRTHISSTELARSVGDVLGRLIYGDETFVIEKNGKPAALLTPYVEETPKSLRDVASDWLEGSGDDPGFADLLDDVGRADVPLEDPWESR